PENQAPSTVNDCARMMMGAIKRFWNRINPVGAAGGAADAYVLTPAVPPVDYAPGEIYAFRAGFANTGPATLAIAGLGPRAIRKYAGGAKQALAPGDIQAGQPVQVAFDGEDMVLMTPSALQPALPPAGVNLVVNGGIQVAQRGPGPFTATTTPAAVSGAYLIDGCYLLCDGADVVEVEQAADAAFASGRGLKATVRTPGAKFGFVWPVESCDIQGVLKDGQAACQLTAVRSGGAGGGSLRLHLMAWSGPADQITRNLVAAWGPTGTDFTPAANWAILGTAVLGIDGTARTVKLQNVAVGPGCTNLAVFAVVDDTTLAAGERCVLGDVQLERGPRCTPFQPAPYAHTLERCQRYFQRATTPGVGGSYALAFATTSSLALIPWRLIPEMRSAPSLSISGPSHFRLEAMGTTDLSLTAGQGSNQKSVDLVAFVSGGLNINATYRLRDNNNGKSYFELSAEI
ncbi:MAG: hypothetical protein IRY94_19975, partial [Rhodospirillaceae bacterium]|nr:hypothetical protein [Rhodospirillaceae bacterium]